MSRRIVASVVVLLALVIVLSPAAAEAALSPHRLQTGFLDDLTFKGPYAAAGFQRAAEAGATIERLPINWSAVAPVRPADPTNPNDPAYGWSAFDAEIAAAFSAGQEPIVNILGAPSWAMSGGGTYPVSYPDPAQFADFAYAAAQRYDGVHGPRITFWEIFNEPNIGLFLEPQFVNGQPQSAIWYRDLLNRSVARIKSVHADNFVVAGSTAPFYDVTPSTLAVNPAWGPLGFLRAVLCLTPQLTVDSAMPGCPTPVAFDAWSHHPYTEGAPVRQATLADDVELGDLPKLRHVLDAGWTAGRITASAVPEIWATEFSWNSNPPDPGGVPASLLERWIPEAMHVMWSNGVTVLTWFQLVDSAPPYQTGFYTSQAALLAAQPKPFLQAFRFPLVAYPAAGGATFWGRTPAGAPGVVVIEQNDGAGGWTTLGQVASDGDGIFEGSLPTSSQRDVRARLTTTGEGSLAFSLTPVPDQFFPSFGRYQLEPTPPPPETTLDSAPSGTVVPQSATFAFSSPRPGSKFECSLDGGAFAGCTSPATYDGLASGAHSFGVRAVDAFGSRDPSPATAIWTVAGSTSPGGGGGGGGGAVGSPNLVVRVTASKTTVEPNGSVDVLVSVGNNGQQTGTGVTLTIPLPPSATLLGPPAFDRGGGCTGAPTISCNLDFLPVGTTSQIRFAVRLSEAGSQTLSASVTSVENDLDPGDNTSSLTLTVGSPTPPPTTTTTTPAPRPAKPIVRPVISAPKLTPAHPTAGRWLTLTFRVRRSDTGALLRSGKMVATPSLNRRIIRHSESFKAGIAKLSFKVPKAARGKLVRVKLTVRAASRSTTRIQMIRIH